MVRLGLGLTDEELTALTRTGGELTIMPAGEYIASETKRKEVEIKLRTELARRQAERKGA